LLAVVGVIRKFR